MMVHGRSVRNTCQDIRNDPSFTPLATPGTAIAPYWQVIVRPATTPSPSSRALGQSRAPHTMVLHFLRFRRRVHAHVLTSTVAITSSVPAMCALVAHGRALPVQLRLASLRATQCPRDRGRQLPGSHPEPAHRVEKRERESVH